MTALGAYFGNDPSALPAYEKWLGRKVDNVLFYLNDWSWKDFDSSIGWAANLWKPFDRPVLWSVPLTVKGTALADVATGNYNDHFHKAAETLAQSKPSSDGFIYVRVGWEFNGSWMPWAAKGNEAAFIGAFRELVDTFREVSNKFKFVWDVNAGGEMNPETAYPGDAYVDVVGMDFYYNKEWDSADPAKAFQDKVNMSYGLKWQQDFAAKHGKETSVSEWGVKSDDSSAFVKAALAWMTKYDMLFQNYWESDYANFSGTLHDGSKPTVGAIFKDLFGVGDAPPSQQLVKPGLAEPTASDDLIRGTGGDDRLALGLGNDTFLGAAGNEIVYGNQGRDSLFGEAGNDTLFGGQDDDVVRGGLDNDIVYGNLGADIIYGNLGQDTLYGGQGNDTAFGGQGDDRLFGNVGDDIVYGNLGNDIVYGNAGADVLYGGQGDDVLDGGQGDDILVGGLGNDTLVGGFGADRYVFGSNPGGRDLILGFNQTEGDRIALGGQTYTVSAAQNGDALLLLSGGGVVDLSGIRADQVNASYFAA